MENIKFKFREIETLQFALLPEAYDSRSEKFQYSIGVSFSFPDYEKKMVGCTCLIQYKGPISSFLILEVVVYFEIEENSWNSLKGEGNNQIKLPKATALHMMTLLIGTARGILHSETKNTEFNRLILPTINLNDLIDRDVIHSFAKPENED